jgi:hypothetical protein
MSVEAKGIQIGPYRVNPETWTNPEKAVQDFDKFTGYVRQTRLRLEKGAYPFKLREIMEEREEEARQVVEMIREAVPNIDQLSRERQGPNKKS